MFVILLPMTLKIINYHLLTLLFFCISRLITTVNMYDRYSVFFVVAHKCRHSIQNSDVTFNVACDLSQPMGKTEFPAPILSHR